MVLRNYFLNKMFVLELLKLFLNVVRYIENNLYICYDFMFFINLLFRVWKIIY